MNNTDNFVQRMAYFMQSIPLFLDEYQLFSGDINKLIMRITEGIDRGKAKAEGGVESCKTWRNVTMLSGEQPVSSKNSGGGTLNRLIEMNIDEVLFEDCQEIADGVKNNYGWAGREFIKFLGEIGDEKIKQLFKLKCKEIEKLGKTAQKQAISMANILVADELARMLFFKDEKPLTVQDIEEYLFEKDEIDNSSRGYDYFIDKVAENESRFVKTYNDERPDESNRAIEKWGKISNYDIMILKTTFENLMENGGFNSKKMIKEWSKRDWIIKNSQGRNVTNTTVAGVQGNYYIIKIIDRDKKRQEEESKTHENEKLREKIKDNANYITGKKLEVDDWLMKI